MPHSHLRDMGIQSFVLISLFFFFLYRTGATGASISFYTFCINCYKIQMCNSIASIFDTNEELVMVDSRTNFAVNLTEEYSRSYEHLFT